MINIKENEQLNMLNHSCAHLLAHAIKNLFPHALFWVGPVIDNGFYYDMDLGKDTILEEDLERIELEMKRISKENLPIIREELSKSVALEMFKNDSYKIDLIKKLADDEIITIYRQGDFADLCRGPHVRYTSNIKHFKLLKVSGAYFEGDSSKQVLQRIYGICFETKEELTNYLNLIEEAKKRDHRKLGRELDLFMMSEYGPGFPFWLPKGLILRKQLEEYWFFEHEKAGYQFIQTPIMLNKELWEISGHWFNYKENMYTSKIDDREFAIKPMNCPGGILVYKNNLHSYKDFPLRVGELGLVHRHEASGALSGLFRVRNFTQDDAHIYLTEDMIENELLDLFKLFDRVYKKFGLNYYVELSTMPEKHIGDPLTWEKAEKALANVATKMGIDLKINPGDGAFYGPKLDFQLTDSLGRVWQCGTIQLDMNLPERFDLTYINEQGEKVRPVMIHRTVYGSIERFIGILIEHYAGAFPTWLAPVQVTLIPVNNELHLEYVNMVAEELKKHHIRVEIDKRDEKLGLKIRNSQMNKTPYLLVLGDKEMTDKNVNVRRYGETNNESMSLNEFINKIK